MTDVETITLTVLRTSDACKAELELQVTKTLNDLKDAISSSPLGPLDPNYQRLFYLGRELKSGGRSLVKLGLGRFENFLVHLHSTQPEACVLSSDDDDDEEEEKQDNGETRKRSSTIIDLIESDEEQEKRQRVS